MCENNPAVMRGIGSVGDVWTALKNVPDSERAFAEKVDQLAHMIATFPNNEPERRAMLALFAAFCNQGFRDHGNLWSVDKRGDLQRHFYMSGLERDNVADLAGL